MKDVEEPSACSGKQLCVNQRRATRATSLLNKDARNWITAVPGLLDFATPLYSLPNPKRRRLSLV